MLRYLLTFVLMMALATSFAQSKKKKTAENSQAPAGQQPSSLSPYYTEKKYEPAKSKKKPNRKTTYNATEDFYDRQEAVAKRDRKAEKEMDKPRYSDPLYFGHIRPPKKRPPSKMKYCKTCGIRH